MSTSHTIIDRRHAAPAIPAVNLREGDTFLDQSTGRYFTVDTAGTNAEGDTVVRCGRLLLTIDSSQLVNLEGK
jgi:hypothetical protein